MTELGIRMQKLTFQDGVAAAALWLAVLAVFAPGSGRLGFYYDDAVWMTSAPPIMMRGLWAHMLGYIPGRNLFVLWEYILYRLWNPMNSLPAIHLVQTALDGLVVACFFLVLRLLWLPAAPSLVAAGLFAFWPIHGETHFWPTLIPANLLTTLFVLLFAMTSLLLVRTRSMSPGVCMLDAASFLAALFTYDQVFGVLVLLLVARLAARWACGGRDRIFFLLHVPYFAAAIFYVRLKLRIRPGGAPAIRPDIWPVLRRNIADTISAVAGRIGLSQVAPLRAYITVSDWLLGIAVAAGVVAMASWLLYRQSVQNRESAAALPFPRPWHVLLLGAVFCIAAYAPNWLWWISPRHHYLPSVGLFMAVAVCLQWVFARASKTAWLCVLMAAGGLTAVFAACGRGESRLWEAAFAAKRQLFAELKPDLRGKDVLVLENFPLMLGDAYLIAPHDAAFGPELLYPEPQWTNPRFIGSIGSSPAPQGIFLLTHALYGPQSFRYYSAGRELVVEYLSFDRNRFCYRKNPPRTPPYEVLPAATGADRLDRAGAGSKSAAFTIQKASAKMEGGNLRVSLDFQSAQRPGACLAATISFLHVGKFYQWGRWDGDNFNLIPILLVPEPKAGAPRALSWRGDIVLHHFPQTARIRVGLFSAGRNADPVLLGQSEAAVEP